MNLRRWWIFAAYGCPIFGISDGWGGRIGYSVISVLQASVALDIVMSERDPLDIVQSGTRFVLVLFHAQG